VIVPKQEVLDDNTRLERKISNEGRVDDFVYKEFEIGACNIFDEVMKKSPKAKIVTGLLAAFSSICCLCALCLFCTFCSLQTKFADLQAVVRKQQEEAGLPDDYEFDEDNIYMLDQKRREQMSSR